MNRTGESLPLLALAGDAHHALAVWVEAVEGMPRVVGWYSHPLEPGRSLVAGLAESCRALGEILGRPVWDMVRDRPLLMDPAMPHRLGLEGAHTVVAALEPLAPPRVGLVGLTQGQSLAAAAQALVAAPCRLVGRWSAPLPEPQALAAAFRQARVDVVVLCGGYVDAAPRLAPALMDLAETVVLALAQLPPGRRPHAIYAGHEGLAKAVRALWGELLGGSSMATVANVLPAPGVPRGQELAVALSRHYWNACLAMEVSRQVARWQSPASISLRSVSWGFAQAVRLWRELHHLPGLHGLRTLGDPWLHVWVEATAEGDRVRVAFTPAGEMAALPGPWPPVGLVSGPWPEEFLGPPSSGQWWDAEGLLPALMAAGPVDARLGLELLWTWLGLEAGDLRP